jgi:hypothetical protein
VHMCHVWADFKASKAGINTLSSRKLLKSG